MDVSPLFKINGSLYYTVALRGKTYEGCKVGSTVIERFNSQYKEVIPVEDAKVAILESITLLQRAVQNRNPVEAEQYLQDIKALLSIL